MLNYKKQDFRSDQLLKAEHLNYIEDGVEQIFNNIEEMCPPLNLEDNLISCYPLEEISLNPKSYVEAKQAGTGEPSPDNIREISGWNAATITRCGKNLLNINNIKPILSENIQISNDSIVIAPGAGLYGIQISNVKLVTGETYAFYADVTGIDEVSGWRLRYEDGTQESFHAAQATKHITKPVQHLYFYIGANMTTTAEVTLSHMQIERGTVSTAYEPYQGNTYTVQFGETIYGGVMNWNTGELTVDRAYINMDEMTYTQYPNQESLFRAKIDGINIIKAGVCSHLPASDSISGNKYAYYARGTEIYLNVGYAVLDKQPSGRTLAGFMEYIQSQKDAGTPIKGTVYIEPYTIQLTPQQILALSDTNNIWSNTGKTKISSFANPAKIIKENEETIEDLKVRTSALEAAIVNNV